MVQPTKQARAFSIFSKPSFWLKETENDAKSIERVLKDQLEVLDIKISSTNRSIEDLLQRIFTNTANNFVNVKYDMDDQKKTFANRLGSLETQVQSLSADFKSLIVDPKSFNNALTKLNVEEKINAKINSSNKKFEREIIYMKLEMDRLFKLLQSSIDEHMAELRSTMALNEASVMLNLNETSLIQKRELQLIREKIAEGFEKAVTGDDEQGTKDVAVEGENVG